MTWLLLYHASIGDLLTTVKDDDGDDYRRNTRRRMEDHRGGGNSPPPLHIRVRNKLRYICESPLKRWHEEIQQVATFISDNIVTNDEHVDAKDEDNNSENDNVKPKDGVRIEFVDISLRLCLEQPLKTPFIAAVALVVNIRHPDVVAELLVNTALVVATGVAHGEWRDVKLALKLLACMQACLAGDGVFPVLDELFDRAGDLQTARSDDVRCTTRLGCLLRYEGK